MSVLNSNNLLSTLIKTGPDASLNLYIVNFRPIKSDLYNSLLSLRTTSAPSLVTRDVVTTTISYNNIDVEIPAAGAQIEKKQTFTLRVDGKYKVLSTLRAYQCIDNHGDFNKDDDRRIEITVDALAPSREMFSDSEFKSVYRWTFYDCYVTNVTPLSYNYESATPATVNVTFIWKTYKEEPINDNDEVAYISGQDVTDNMFNSISSLIKKGTSNLPEIK